MYKKELTQNQKELILDYYCNQKQSITKVSEKLNISKYLISKFLRENQLTRAVGTERKYFHKEDYFENIITEKQAY